MQTYPIGNTGIQASDISFGALPVQRRTHADAVRLLQRALDEGINFYDTARGYTDSEQKLGDAFAGKRAQVFIASKVSGAATPEAVKAAAEQSLRALRTEYVDILQFHNPGFVPRPGGQDGLYDALRTLQQQGKVRFLGFTNHALALALEAAESGLYDTVQFPISYLSSEADLQLAATCREHGVGLLAMKPLAGGLLSNANAIYTFFSGFRADCTPLYGIQHEWELDAFLQAQRAPMQAEALHALIEKDRESLSGEFCRSCGYCMPCPAGIPLHNAMRMYWLLRRSPAESWFTANWYEGMQKTKDCTGCGQCVRRCPYGLNPPKTLPVYYADYMAQYEAYKVTLNPPTAPR